MRRWSPLRRRGRATAHRHARALPRARSGLGRRPLPAFAGTRRCCGEDVGEPQDASLDTWRQRSTELISLGAVSHRDCLAVSSSLIVSRWSWGIREEVRGRTTKPQVTTLCAEDCKPSAYAYAGSN